MNTHLSEEQFAKCLAEQSTNEERQHLALCRECSLELDRFRGSISLFSNALTNSVEVRLALRPSLEIGPTKVSDPRWRWGLVAATALILALMPFIGLKTNIIPRQQVGAVTEQSDTDADALMWAVQLQLSRTIPEPMEPVIALLPTEESPTPTRGVQ
jgi:hypothetical protein